MITHINNVFLATCMSSQASEPWAMVPFREYTPRSANRAIRYDDMDDKDVLGLVEIAVTWDMEFRCLEAAQGDATFEGIGNLSTALSGIGLFAPNGLLAVWYGKERLAGNFTTQNRDGDLVVEFKDRVLFGFPAPQ